MCLCAHMCAEYISLAEKRDYWLTREYAFNILIDTAQLSSKKSLPIPLPTAVHSNPVFYTLPHILLLPSFLFGGSSDVEEIVYFNCYY